MNSTTFREPRLWIVATPLGNLQDITSRTVDALKTVEIWFAEDTREFRKLLSALGIPSQRKQIFSLSQHNLKGAVEQALGKLREGSAVGLATDRGTPGISDPGYELVAEARQEGISVLPLPGPSSPIAALSVSGMPADQFLFLGFLPRETQDRKGVWDKVRNWNHTTVFLESPQRIRKTLEEVQQLFPNAEVFAAREMTKVHEEYLHFFCNAPLPEFAERGEFTIVLRPHIAPPLPNSEAIDALCALRLASERDWSKRVALELGLTAHEVYNHLQQLKRTSSQSDK